MKNRIIEVLRWIAVPFASVAASLLVHVIITLFVGMNNVGYMLYTGTEVTSITEILLGLARDFLVGSVFVLAGAYTAPVHRRTVAVVLATVASMLCVVSLAFSIAIWNGVLQCMSAVLTMTGSIVAAKVNDWERISHL